MHQLIGMFDGETFSKIHFHNNILQNVFTKSIFTTIFWKLSKKHFHNIILQNVFPTGTLLNLLWHICFPYRWKLPIYKSVTVLVFHHLGQIAVERKEFPYGVDYRQDLWKNCQKMVASHIVGCGLWICGLCTNCLSGREASLLDSAILSTGLSRQRLQCIVSACPRKQWFSKINNKCIKWKRMSYDWISRNGGVSVWLAALIESLPQVSSQ